jgi:DNA repair exonuclease SbcCD ATPase subunit
MSILIIGVIAFSVALAIAGIFYILNGYRTGDAEVSAVPLSHEEIKKIRNSFEEGSLKGKGKPEILPKITGQNKMVITNETGDVELLKKENDRLRNALENEISLKASESNSELKSLQDQLRDVRSEMEKLTSETEGRKKLIDEMGLKLSELQKKLEDSEALRLSLETQANQKNDINPELERLNKECARLKESEAAERLLRNQMSAEKERQMQVWAEREKKYEENIRSLKEMIAEWENNSRTKRAQDDEWKNALIKKNDELNSKNEEKKNIIKDLEKQIIELKLVINDKESKKQDNYLDKDMAALTEQIKRLEEFNSFLQEKERKMQYELVKNRAQTLGLEQMCEDLKRKLENLSLRS